jgi:hypothetical protein
MRTLPLLALLPLLFSACGGGGGSGGVSAIFESEPNGSAATANALSLDRPAAGTIGAADLDFWAFAATVGDLISVEIVATRLDQAAWDAGCNTPRLTLFRPDQTTKHLEHDVTLGWDYGGHDLDFPLIRIPESGTWYLCVASDPGVAPAGDYALLVRKGTPATYQQEAEPAGTTGVNDTSATAQAITPGTLQGFHTDDNSDFYSFTITGPTVACFETISQRNGTFGGDTDYFTPELRIYGTDGTTVITSESETFFGDAQACVALLAAGTYFVEVREDSGGGDAGYFLTYAPSNVSSVPVESEANNTSATANPVSYGTVTRGAFISGDSDFYRFTAAAGDMVHAEVAPVNVSAAVVIEFRSSNGTTVLSADVDSYAGLREARTILTAGGTYYVRVTTSAGVASDYFLSLSRRLNSRFESEPNDEPVDFDQFDNSGRASGVISAPGDVDLFRFSLFEGEMVICSIFAAPPETASGGSNGFHVLNGHGSTLRPRIRILRNDGTVLATSLQAPPGSCATTEDIVDGLPTCAVALIAPSDNTYYVEVGAQDGTGSASHHYVVQVR